MSALADQVDRQWSEMSLKDIQVSPFEWESGANAPVCKVRGSPEQPGLQQCSFFLKLESEGLAIEGNVSWFESEPATACEQTLSRHCGPGNEGRFVMTGGGRAAMAFVVPWISGGTGVGFDRLESERGSMLRILDDIVARIELYAIPCSCNGQPIGNHPAGTRTSRPTPTRSEESGSRLPSVTPPSHVTRPGGGLLGQGSEAPCIEGVAAPGCPASRAMRRTGGFPPGVEVAALKFYASGKSYLDKDKRVYSARFGSDVQYVYVELNLRYPQRQERFDFDMEVDISKNGLPFVHFTQTGMSLEPGWTDSHHSGGWGNSSGNFWPPDWYYVEVSVGGEVVAKGQFEVVASAP